MSIRLYLRCAGTVGRWMAPGPKITGSPVCHERAQQPAHPADAGARPASSARTRTISASSRSPTSAARTSGRPVAARAVRRGHRDRGRERARAARRSRRARAPTRTSAPRPARRPRARRGRTRSSRDRRRLPGAYHAPYERQAEDSTPTRRSRPSSPSSGSTTGISRTAGSAASTTPTAGRRRSWRSTPSATCARPPWHHADLAVTWGKLWVKLATHSAGGITDKDFKLARKIEDTILWRPERRTARSTGRWASSCSRSSAGRTSSSRAHVVDALEVEHDALGLEQPLHACRSAASSSAPRRRARRAFDAVLLLEVVAAADALDADRVGGRVVDHDLAAPAQPLRRRICTPGRAGGEDRRVAVERGVELVARLPARRP